jgi:hypothetical protein
MPVPTDGDPVRFARENTGGYGCIGVADTAAHAASAAVGGLPAGAAAFTSFLFLAATVFTTATPSNADKCGDTGVPGVTFPAGSTWFTNLSTFTLASGSCVAYYGPRL